MPETMQAVPPVTVLAESIVRTVREPLVVLDGELKVIFASDAFYRVFKVEPGETLGRHIYELGSGEWSEDGLRRLLDDILPHNAAFEDYLVDYDFPRIGRRIMKLNGRRIERTGGAGPLILFAIEDITRRKDIEKRLEESNNLVENSPDIMVCFDRQKRYLFANRVFDEGAGLPREKVIGKRPDEMQFPSNFVRSIDAVLDRVIRTGEQTISEIPFGESVYQTRIVPVTDAHGSLVSIMAYGRNITSLKETEEALKVSEENFRSLAHNLPDIVARYGCDLRYRYINPAGERLLGKPRNEIVGRTNAELGLPAKLVAFLHDNFKTICETKEGMTMEFSVPFPGGERCISSHMVPELDARGNVASLLSINRDITPLKEAERSLRESEERFRMLVEASPDAITYLDAEGKILYVNARTAQMLGYDDVSQLIGRNSFSFVLPADRPRAQKQFTQAMKTGIMENVEYAALRKDGGYFPVEASARVIRGPRGEIAGMVAVSRDVSRIKEAERSLRESEEKYRILVERSNDGIIIVQDGTLVFANRRMAELDGSSVEQLVGTSYMEHVCPDEVPKMKEIYRRRMVGEPVPTPYETVLKRRNGEPAPAEINGSVINYRGKPADIVIIRDISQRKKTEEALRESEERFRTLVEASPDAITFTDVEGKILYTNQRTAEMHGDRDVRGLIGHSAFSLIAPEDRPRAMQNLKRTLETGITEELEYRLLRKDGSSFPGELSAKVIRDAQGNCIGFIGVSRDITERERIRQELARREEEYRTLAENSPDIIIRYDADYRFRYVNPKAAAMFRRPASEIIGKRVDEVSLSREGGEYWEARIKEIFASRKEEHVEYVTPPVGGERVHFDVHLVPEYGGSGKLVSILAISRNITQLKRTERRLTEALALARKRAGEAAEGQQMLTTLMDNIAEGLLITDAEGKVRFMSGYLSRITGIPMEEAPGKDVAVIDDKLSMPEQPVPARREYPITLALKRGEVTIAEERTVRSMDGRIMTVLINAQPIRSADGAIIGALASWRDITERKRTENALRRNEYELRTLVDNSPDIIIRFDRHLRYAYVNPAFERITGISREDFAGKTNEELGMPKERRDVWEGAAREVFESGRDGTVEFDMTSFFGKRYFSGRVIPEFAKDGSVETVMIIARDITERKHYEERIRFISFHDAVTGLYNRAYYEEELRRIDTERELPISIIMGDVNNLKLSNDVLGHEEGDRLLKAIADAIKRACRKNDIIARWGGDEFAVLLPKTDYGTAEAVRSRIQQIAGESTGTIVRPSIALGVAVKDRRDLNINLVVRRAEERMYANKMAEAKKNEENVLSSLLAQAKERTQDISVHVERSYDLARRFGKALGLSEEQEKDLELLIRMHDIGMAVVPREVLTKPGRLNEDEWRQVRRHPEAGFEIVRSFADISRISDEVLAHDERWDGSGYPRGLTDGKIPYLARVFALIEAYDVMTHPRPYARTLSPEEAVEELRLNAGTQFDPELVKTFIEVVSPTGVPA